MSIIFRGGGGGGGPTFSRGGLRSKCLFVSKPIELVILQGGSRHPIPPSGSALASPALNVERSPVGSIPSSEWGEKFCR